MSLQPNLPIRSLVGKRSDYPDPFTRGLVYLQQVQQLALEANLIDSRDGQREQVALCTWIGLHIDTINSELHACLSACQACFHEWERHSVQIYAAPFRDAYGIDGLCNLHTVPPTILIDVGRVTSRDWLGVVAHEYAHAHVGTPGHDQAFQTAIAHLCLGLGLALPPQVADDRLCHWPPSHRTSNAIGFWLGHNWPCALPLTAYYSQISKGD